MEGGEQIETVQKVRPCLQISVATRIALKSGGPADDCPRKRDLNFFRDSNGTRLNFYRQRDTLCDFMNK